MGSDVSFKGSRTLLVSVIRLSGIMVASSLPLYAIHRLCGVAPHITDDRLMCRVILGCTITFAAVGSFWIKSAAKQVAVVHGSEVISPTFALISRRSRSSMSPWDT
jgi:hypothetical protein